jgi:hypothetical protein
VEEEEPSLPPVPAAAPQEEEALQFEDLFVPAQVDEILARFERQEVSAEAGLAQIRVLLASRAAEIVDMFH